MKTFLFAITALTAVASASSASAATTVSASGQGWVTQTGNANGSTPSNNYIAGNCGAGDCGDGEYRNFFTFNLPTFYGTVSNAALILNTASLLLSQNNSITYTITSTSGLNFAQLGTGTVFSSDSFNSGQNNQQASFQFNAAGLAALQSGQSITLSGRVTSPTTFGGSAPDQALFGSSGQNASLQFDTVAAVPEPATWLMMMAGFGMIGFGLRRRSKVSTSVKFA